MHQKSLAPTSKLAVHSSLPLGVAHRTGFGDGLLFCYVDTPVKLLLVRKNRWSLPAGLVRRTTIVAAEPSPVDRRSYNMSRNTMPITVAACGNVTFATSGERRLYWTKPT